MTVVDLVPGVVVVLQEIPAAYIVYVAVLVVVLPVREPPDNVLGVEDTVVVQLCVHYPGVTAVVVDVERTVMVCVPGLGSQWRGQLTFVQVALAREVGLAPVDAGVQLRYQYVRPAGGDAPGPVDTGPHDPLEFLLVEFRVEQPDQDMIRAVALIARSLPVIITAPVEVIGHFVAEAVILEGIRVLPWRRLGPGRIRRYGSPLKKEDDR